MSLGKQAKILTDKQQKVVLDYLSKTRHPIRNELIFLFSFKAGFRAVEIASATWGMICNSDGKIDNFIKLENKSAKGKSGRVIPLNKQLKAKLEEYKNTLSNPNLKFFFKKTESF